MIAPGAVGWMVLAVAGLLWLTLVAVSSGQLVGPARLTRWILGSWLARLLILTAWAAAGWHLFCQRP